MRIAAKCIRLRQIQADLKQLKKKFPSVEKDLEYAERLLEAGQSLPQTYPYPGFGEDHSIYKTRVVNTSQRKGKSTGYRLIYEIIEPQDDTVILLILLYGKTTISDENKVRIEIKTRLRSPDYPKIN